ncbi:hypothetical protein AX16_003333 [Volvariella volvacea WC 439]|nr:hypothetical protein AX16_003333 [Volvariella volvacea WC 439]
MLSLPTALFLNVQYQNYLDWKTARAMGAELPPKLPDRTPGGLAILMAAVRNHRDGYPGEDLEPFIREFGHTFVLRLLFTNRIFTTEPGYLKAILATQFEDFDKGVGMKRIVSTLLGRGVFAEDGEIWRFHRSISRPFFTKDRIQHYDIFDRHAEEALNQMRARLKEGYPVDFQELVSRFTLDSASEFLFGQDAKSLSAGMAYPHYSPLHEKQQQLTASHPANRFFKALAEAQLKTSFRVRYGSYWPVFEFWEDRVKGPMKIVHDFIQPILEEALRAKKEMEEKGLMENKEPDTLVEHLVNSVDDQIIIRDEIMSLLVAGKDTTASALTFIVYMLAEHPSVLRRLREEILTQIGPTRRPTPEDFRDMKYLRAVINETLRLYPPVPFNFRISNKPTSWAPLTPDGKRFYIPPRSGAMYSVWMMHRRKDFWGPDALIFDPDRFLDNRLHEYLVPNPYIFLPFNAGPRICLGQNFAYNEVSFFLVRLLQAFEEIEVDVEALPEDCRVPKSWNRSGKGKDDGEVAQERTKEAEKIRPNNHLTLYAMDSFSHHRVTAPPPSWSTAAHRQGVKMLGTLIFEGGSEPDCLRLLVGKLPKSKTGSAAPVNPHHMKSLPISPHYARLLADLAVKRGFDGYLLNFEVPLQGGVEQTQALAAWICFLRSELQEKVGPHAEVIWYDSVIVDGRLAWQDRLNSFNLPFFLPSTGFFTNYTWRNNYPEATAQYFLTLGAELIGSPSPSVPAKSLNDIYVGVDVWGRGSHGGGGFGCYKAIGHISPESMGLSVALFGQAWSWETEQDKPGFTWESWWKYDRHLWVGLAEGNSGVNLPDAPMKRGELPCTHGPFTTLSQFFTNKPPPNPLLSPLYVSFSPGIGNAWFVQGRKVFEAAKGWTDIDKQTSLGDLVWPRPELRWEGGDWEDEIPKGEPELCFDDAWNGGSSLKLQIDWKGSESETAAYRCIWVPMQSVALSTGQSYDVSIVYKIQTAGEDSQLEIGLSVNALDKGEAVMTIEPVENDSGEVGAGWSKLTVQAERSDQKETANAVGLVVALMAEDPTQDIQTSILVGQISVSPTISSTLTPHTPQIVWVDHEHDSKSNTGTLAWEIASSYPYARLTAIKSPDDAIVPWKPHPTTHLPSFAYFNIFAQHFNADSTIGPAENAIWIGTSGLDGYSRRFLALKENLEARNIKQERVRYYVQGVTANGEVLSWDKCAYVDV